MTACYLINAYPERRLRASSQLHDAGFAEIQYIEPPLGRGVRGLLYPCRRWRDPNGKRLLTWGELSCFEGHRRAWDQIAQGNPEGGFIFEDDVKCLTSSSIDIDPRGDLIYLGGKFLDEPGPVEDGYKRAPYTYWAIGYWISQAGARMCLEHLDTSAIVPVDEYLPALAGVNPNLDLGLSETLETWAVAEWAVEPCGKWPSGTETDDFAFELKVWIIATDRRRAQRTISAYEDLGYDITILGEGSPGWDTSGEGGAKKLNLVREALQQASVQDIVLCSDGYDVLPLLDPAAILARFAEFGRDVVISGERNFWPPGGPQEALDELHARSEYTDAPYRYPCSGLHVGFSEGLRTAHRFPLEWGDGDDQRWWHRVCVEDPDLIGIDREGYLFQSLGGAEADLARKRGQVLNAATNCYPAILHGNGGADLEAAQPAPWAEPDLAEDTGQWIEVAEGILAMPFLAADYCAHLAQAAAALGGWKALDGDAVPGDELRLNRFDWVLHAWIIAALNDTLSPVVNSRWRPAAWHPPSDLFFIRHQRGRQDHIDLHEDISYFSGSVALQRARSGGALYFPRQNYFDEHLPLGWLLLWPSRITHPHQVLPVRAGRRVSMVMWTEK